VEVVVVEQLVEMVEEEVQVVVAVEVEAVR
jgi:hypothetical protein